MAPFIAGRCGRARVRRAAIRPYGPRAVPGHSVSGTRTSSSMTRRRRGTPSALQSGFGATGRSRSEPQQDSQSIFDRCHRVRHHGAPPLDQAICRDRSYPFAKYRCLRLQAAFGWRDRNMRRYGANRRGHWQDDHQSCRTTVEQILRYDEHRAPTGLVVPAGRAQIGKPDFSSGGRSHALFRGFLRLLRDP